MIQSTCKSIIGIFAVVLCPMVFADVPIHIVAETNTQAPGFAAGVRYSSISHPVIGSNGHVAFTATLVGPGIIHSGASTSRNADTLWIGRPGNLRVVVQQGDPAPVGQPGVEFDVLRDRRIIVSPSGDVAFFASLRGPVTAANDIGLFAEINGNLRLLMREGDAARGLGPGNVITDFFNFVFNDAGVAVFARTNNNPFADGLWAGNNRNAMRLIAAEGRRAPLAGCIFSNLIGTPAINASGTVVFSTGLSNTASAAACPRTLFRWSPGVFKKIVSLGDTAPGLPPGTTFISFDGATNSQSPKINHNDAVIFPTEVKIPGNSFGRSSIWVSQADGSLELFALEGETLPNSTSLDNFSPGVLNSAGETAVLAWTYDGSTHPVILSGVPRPANYPTFASIGASLQTVIAQDDTRVPGESSMTFTHLYPPLINALGDIAFLADVNTLSGAKTGIWLDIAGDLQRVISTGDPINISGTLRTPTTIYNITASGADQGAGDSDGLPRQLSDSGELIFRAVLDRSSTAIILVGNISADQIGAWRPVNGRFYLDINGNNRWDNADLFTAPFGFASDIPVIGDWNGDGADEIGIWRPSTRQFYLDVNGNNRWDNRDLVSAPFGFATDIPVIGDWNGDGTDEIGVWRPANRRFYLDANGSNSWNARDIVSAPFGFTSDTPVSGDWNGDGIDEIGVWRPVNGRFYLDADGSNSWNARDIVSAPFGITSDIPVIGDWNNDGADEIGVWRPANRRFYLDADGSNDWDTSDTITAPFGFTSDMPMVGKW